MQKVTAQYLQGFANDEVQLGYKNCQIFVRKNIIS